MHRATTSRISLVVPCYKQAALLVDCLESFQAQSLKDWEAIVVDDASPDGDSVRDVVEALDDRRIRLVRNAENAGLSGSRNVGARLATGDLISFVDADDKLDARYCEVAIRLFDSNQQLDVVYGPFKQFGDTTDIMRSGGVYNEMRFRLKYWLPAAGFVVRRAAWEQTGGYCEHPLLRSGMEGNEFWISTIGLDLAIASTVEPLYLYRRYAGTQSKLQDRYRHLHQRFIARRHRQTLKGLGLYHAFLADGYLRAARVFYQQGHQSKAWWLALRGLFHEPHNRELRKYWLRAAAPPALRAILSRLRQHYGW